MATVEFSAARIFAGTSANDGFNSEPILQTTYTLVYDAENRLVKVTWGSNSATFKYDGQGNRIKASITVSGTTTTTAYVGNYYELSGSTATKYYFAGAQMVAQRKGSALYTLFGDHLGSITVTEDSAGHIIFQGYYPWGGIRTGTSNALPTDNTFTDQKTIESIGLMFYNARYYDSSLGRWVQPDTVIPDIYDPLDLDRYQYVLSNPVNLNDPSGHTACWDEHANDPECRGKIPSIYGVAYKIPDPPFPLPSTPVITPTQTSPTLLPSQNWFVTPTPTPAPQINNNNPSISEWKQPDFWDTNPHHPDYYVLTGNVGSVLGGTLTLVWDRYGNAYIGPGGNVGKSISLANISLNGGWIGSATDNDIPDQANIGQFLTGLTINGQAGTVGDVAFTWSPFAGNYISHTAVEYGGVLPFSVGISATFGIKVWNGYSLFGK